jgi:hypothetical protein
MRATAQDLGAVQMATLYTIECVAQFHRDGSKCAFHGLAPMCRERDHEKRTLWRDQFHNLVVTEGLNELLARSFDAVAANVNWYVGLIGAGTGTVAITSAASAVTGTGTTFDANLATAPKADIIIVGAGAAGADLVDTVNTRSSGTALATAATPARPCRAPRSPPSRSPATRSRRTSTAGRKSCPTRTAPGRPGRRTASPSGGAMSNSSSKASFTVNAPAASSACSWPATARRAGRPASCMAAGSSPAAADRRVGRHAERADRPVGDGVVTAMTTFTVTERTSARYTGTLKDESGARVVAAPPSRQPSSRWSTSRPGPR